MLTGAHYPIKKMREVVGDLPYSTEEGVNQTLCWMFEQGLVRNRPVSLKQQSISQK